MTNVVIDAIVVLIQAAAEIIKICNRNKKS